MTSFTDSVSIIPPSGVHVALTVECGGSGSPGEFNWNAFAISPDSLDTSNTKANGLYIDHAIGGTTTTGLRNAVEGVATLVSPTSVGNTERFYTGGTFTGDIQSSDGGSGSVFQGAGFGLNGVGLVRSAAQNIDNITAAEFNVTAEPSSSVRYKSVIQLTTGGGGSSQTDSVQGSEYDCSIGISCQNGVGTRNGILFGPMNGIQPISSDGVLISTTGSSTIYRGIDFSSYDFTDAVLVAPNLSITSGSISLTKQNAGLELGSQTVQNTPYIDFHSSGAANDYDARIIVSGGNPGTVGNGAFQFISDSLGFYGGSPVTKPVVTGSRAGNSALQSLLNALSSLGLIIDNSTS